jgi:hypothetical protein
MLFRFIFWFPKNNYATYLVFTPLLLEIDKILIIYL